MDQLGSAGPLQQHEEHDGDEGGHGHGPKLQGGRSAMRAAAAAVLMDHLSQGGRLLPFLRE